MKHKIESDWDFRLDWGIGDGSDPLDGMVYGVRSQPLVYGEVSEDDVSTPYSIELPFMRFKIKCLAPFDLLYLGLRDLLLPVKENVGR